MGFVLASLTNSIKMPQNVISKLFTIDSQLIDTHTRRLHLIRFEFCQKSPQII